MVVRAEGEPVIHRYAVLPGPDEAHTGLQRVAVETRGSRPTSVESPVGWTASVTSAHHVIYGCEWRIEWEIKRAMAPRAGRVAGLVARFPGDGPTHYCYAELDFRDGPTYGFGGEDHVAGGVP